MTAIKQKAKSVLNYIEEHVSCKSSHVVDVHGPMPRKHMPRDKIEIRPKSDLRQYTNCKSNLGTIDVLIPNKRVDITFGSTCNRKNKMTREYCLSYVQLHELACTARRVYRSLVNRG